MSVSETSLEAYKGVNISHNEQIVFNAIADQGVATIDSVSAQLGWEANRVSGRFTGLSDKGLITIHDRDGRTRYGKRAIRWCIKDPNDGRLKKIAKEVPATIGWLYDED